MRKRTQASVITSGTYALSGHDGPYAVERFRCEQTAQEWRYVGVREHPTTGAALGRIDLLVDLGGRILRLEVSAGDWLLRGGVVGPEAIWRRGGEERSERAHGFTGTSPAYVVVAARLGPGQRRFVAVHDAALATSTVDQEWTGAGADWECSDLATGDHGRWRLSGGVVTAGPGLTLTTD